MKQRFAARHPTDLYGPESFVGAICGLVCISTIFVRLAASDSAWPYLAPVLVGAALLPFYGPLRRFGIGLLISLVALPLAVMCVLFVLAIVNQFS